MSAEEINKELEWVKTQESIYREKLSIIRCLNFSNPTNNQRKNNIISNYNSMLTSLNRARTEFIYLLKEMLYQEFLCSKQ
jgi:hypothetical protein